MPWQIPIMLLVLLIVSTPASLAQSSYEQLAMAHGASYAAHRIAENAANRCAHVSPGTGTSTNGKQVQWSGISGLRRVANTCRQISDDMRAKIYAQYPTQAAGLEREMDREFPKLEAYARQFTAQSFSNEIRDPRVGCWLLEHAVTQAAAKHCVTR